MAGQQPVGPGLKRRRVEHGRRNVFVPLVIVSGGGKIDGHILDRRQSKNRLAIVVIEPGRLRLARLEPTWPVGLGEAEMHLRKVLIADSYCRPRRGPRPLRLDREILGLDLCDEVSAEDAARALWMSLQTLQSERTGRDQIGVVLPIALLQQARQLKLAQGRQLVIARPIDEALERVFLSVVQRLRVTSRYGHTACPQDPVEVG